LSYLAYGSFGATVEGLNDFSADQVPDNIELLYYGYHIMVGLGTLFLLLTSAAVAALFLGKLYTNRILLWLLMLAFPFPYIATTAGWMVAELGRQPWLIYGLQRTIHGTSPLVYAGNVAFSTIGFMGLYVVVGLLFLYLVLKEIKIGPESPPISKTAAQASPEV
jgi:cytochrome d ubiquinol oxidase subunit I